MFGGDPDFECLDEFAPFSGLPLWDGEGYVVGLEGECGCLCACECGVGECEGECDFGGGLVAECDGLWLGDVEQA